MLIISYVAEQLLASQTGLTSMELVATDLIAKSGVAYFS
jgi:hypothetical protein